MFIVWKNFFHLRVFSQKFTGDDPEVSTVSRPLMNGVDTAVNEPTTDKVPPVTSEVLEPASGDVHGERKPMDEVVQNDLLPNGQIVNETFVKIDGETPKVAGETSITKEVSEPIDIDKQLDDEMSGHSGGDHEIEIATTQQGNRI